ncbi:MAG: competence protein ComE [Clostridiales bacterium]|nr:competence protein ComE [Clostridiales bacterium]
MKSFLNRDYIENFVRYHKKIIIKVAVGFVLFTAAFFVFCIRDYKDKGDEFTLINNSDKQFQLEEESVEDSDKDLIAKEEQKKDKIEKIYIDISGAVKNPYVYEVKEGTRVYEVIELAGGLKADADISNLNLAQVLRDEDKITVLTKEQIADDINQQSIQNNKAASITNASDRYGQKNLASAEHEININTASSEELQTINGIGPSTAEKILMYREEKGKFKKTEELMNVSGIGEKTFNKLKNKITV